MSIIAIKDRKLAWDSQLTVSGGMKWGMVDDKVKRYRRSGHTYFAGGCGHFNQVQSFYRFLDGFGEPEDWDTWLEAPKYNCHASSTVFLFDPSTNQIFEFGDRGPPILLSLAVHNYAIGTGTEYAYGAMDSGKSAYEAVKMVVKKFDGCGEPIHRAEWRKR